MAGKAPDQDFQTNPKATGQLIQFSCGACGAALSATISEVRTKKKCVKCGDENIVPLPKIKVGGGRDRGARQSKVRQPKRPTKTIEQPSENTTDDDKLATTPVPIRSKKSTPINSLLLIGLLLFVSIVVGWSGLVFGPQVLASISGREDDENLVITSVPAEKMNIGPDNLQKIRDFWKAAQIAKETIETDLNVSLAEMEKLGMNDQADIVRRAIEKKQEKISESQVRFAVTMVDIAKAYLAKPKEVDKLFSDFLNTEAIRTDPDAQDFLETTHVSLSQVPADPASYTNYFEQIFKSNNDNKN